nr:MAG TPA: hypothetical protein [Caudoviricetes sp.]
MVYCGLNAFYICVKLLKIRIVTRAYCMICNLRLSILINNLRYIFFIFRSPVAKPIKEFI